LQIITGLLVSGGRQLHFLLINTLCGVPDQRSSA